PEALGLMQYTSGSTGDPKGVMLTHWGLLENVRSMGHAMEASSADVFVSWLPLYHDMGLIGAWLGCCYFGARLYVMSPISFLIRPVTWLWTMHKYRATFSGGPNFAFELCASRGYAEPADESDADAIEMVACGHPIEKNDVRVVDDAGRELGERHEGMLEFRGPSITKGYFRNEPKTRELFHDGWIKSGDRAYIANGDIHITGRVKDIIIRAGRNTYPQEIEEAVAAVPGIRKGGVAAF